VAARLRGPNPRNRVGVRGMSWLFQHGFLLVRGLGITLGLPVQVLGFAEVTDLASGFSLLSITLNFLMVIQSNFTKIYRHGNPFSGFSGQMCQG
jgi:hypothetical protein